MTVGVSEALASDPKADLRATALAARDALSPDMRAAAAETIAARQFPIGIPAGVIVSGYSPMRSELSPLPLMRKFAEAGAQLALPVVQKRGQPLVMRAFALGDELARGQWGIREPKPDAPEVFPDIMLVPLAAFDRAGHRIGYGAGYYDITIASIRAMKPVMTVGLAFAAQEIDKVPATPRDERLDLVLTEREVIDLRRT
ncbi:MAG: 5-formyltetrahydrofolate cyclo-ligase [Pseudorhodoplanes sp.]|nr:5-formyltetrahydrofolate cyclo-ligase [Pseudorhodoplanes sp.]